jgi:MacB-like periplasmic core domain/Cupin domain
LDRSPSEGVEPRGSAAYRHVGRGTRYVRRALGIPLRRDRDFRENDTAGAPRTAIINESFARQAFRNSDPLGRVIFCAFDSLEPMTIVGVGGKEFEAGPGDILVIKAGEVHSFTCIGDVPLVQLDVHLSSRFIQNNAVTQTIPGQ